MELLGDELKALKGIGTSQEDQENQLTWTSGSSQRLSHQQKIIHGLDCAPPQAHKEQMCSSGSMWVPQQLEQGGAVLKAVAWLWNPFLNRAGLSGLGWGNTQGLGTPSQGMGRGRGGTTIKTLLLSSHKK